MYATKKSVLSDTGARRQSKTSRRQAVEGYLYLMPWLLGLIIFYLGPMVTSFALSFTKYDVVRPAEPVGFTNYTRAVAQDMHFWPSLYRTFYYSVVMVPVGMVGSLLAALLLNQNLKGTAFLRTCFFLPSLTPSVAAAFIWKWIMHPEAGLLNFLLWKVGIKGPGWMSDITWAIPSLIIVALWGAIGGTSMIIFLAGLQGVPEEYYEAAEIDGANVWHRFLNVTLPMISPAFLFNLIMGVIGALQVFTTAYVATDGGPGRATWFFALHIYRNAFEYFYMGYASSLAWIFLIIILVLTVANFQLSGRWVYYEGEARR
jgi:multiple sugar transport system permease protein